MINGSIFWLRVLTVIQTSLTNSSIRGIALQNSSNSSYRIRWCFGRFRVRKTPLQLVEIEFSPLKPLGYVQGCVRRMEQVYNVQPNNWIWLDELYISSMRHAFTLRVPTPPRPAAALELTHFTN